MDTNAPLPVQHAEAEAKYAATWGTPVGKDCIDLCSSLPRWLGDRLLFLGQHTKGVPLAYMTKYTLDNEAEDLDVRFDTTKAYDAWRVDLTLHGNALIEHAITEDPDDTLEAAQKALRWVADYLPNLWD